MIKKTLQYSNAAVKILQMSITSVLLYILALTMPITGFLLPVYKIKAITTLNRKSLLILFHIAVPAAILLTVGILDSLFDIKFTYTKTLGCYFLVFVPIEILYFFFLRLKVFIPEFDRIIITGVIISFLVYIYLQNAGAEVEYIKKSLEEFYLKKYNIDSKSLEIIFKIMRENALYIIYTYLGAVVYLTYYSLNRKRYPVWKISYQWLLFYIIPFLIMRFTSIKNIYLTNIMEIAKISFIVYGVKILYIIIKSKIKIDAVSQIMAIMIGFAFPNFLFIIAGLNSFEIIKVKVIKN